MKKVFLFWFVIFSLFNCKTQEDVKNKNHPRLIAQDLSNALYKKEKVRAMITSVDSTKYSYQIFIKSGVNVRLVLSDKKNDITKLIIGKLYDFELAQLTHANFGRSDSIFLNGRKIAVMPTLHVQDCIMFNSEKFCSSYYEVYKLIRIIYDIDHEKKGTGD